MLLRHHVIGGGDGRGQRERLARWLEAMDAAQPLRQVIRFGSHGRGEACPERDVVDPDWPKRRGQFTPVEVSFAAVQSRP